MGFNTDQIGWVSTKVAQQSIKTGFNLTKR